MMCEYFWLYNSFNRPLWLWWPPFISADIGANNVFTVESVYAWTYCLSHFFSHLFSHLCFAYM